jgi:hypothetical protein
VTRQSDIISINQKRTALTECMDSVAEVSLKVVSPDELEGLGHHTPQACEASLVNHDNIAV